MPGADIQVRHAGDEEFAAEVLDVRDELVIAYFWGPDCPNCDFFATRLPGLLKELAGAKCRLVKVNAYEHPSVATAHAIAGVPQFFLYRDGERLGRMSEFKSDGYWLAVIREHLPG